ncbi:MAG TPA: interleukin-like EMT inducer domain-containing protein [Candidatus Hydrogenedentes bacterium]|nr:interleukin-like EMT inducer domain-containing protein [Candidatus Hydrogenedentota bacterium]
MWLVIAVLFAGFNAVYWPVRAHQIQNAPDNFMSHASYLYAHGAQTQAIKRLKEGIARFHPVCPEPYQVLAEWHFKETKENLPWCMAAGYFYQALRGEGKTRSSLLTRAAEMESTELPKAIIKPEIKQPVSLLAGNLGLVWGVGETLLTLPVERQLAILSLSGGNSIDFHGRIGRTGVKSPVNILVQSGGGRAGRYCTHLLVRGREYAGNRRGFYAILIDPQSGQVTQMGMFDVWQSEEEAARMENFLKDAPTGMIGAFAVADEASVNLTSGLENALSTFGLEPRTFINSQPALFGLHYSFAALGVKGAAEDTAVQAWSPDEFDGCEGHAVTCGTLRLAEDGT